MRPDGRLAKGLHYLSWHFAAGAVLKVFHENQRREQEPGTIKASSDCWCINDRLRREIHERAGRIWSTLSKQDHTYFPLSVDAVARLYFRIRKRRSDEIEEFDREIAEALELSPGGLWPED